MIKFLENKDPESRDHLISPKNDIAYLTDLYKLLNDVNLQLNDLNSIKTKHIVLLLSYPNYYYTKEISADGIQ